jgi:prepilin-type N-terminal cleavage/methylation domain-containing protein
VRHRVTRRGSVTRRRGVTLLELIVVMALLGLVLAIAAPALIAPAEKREPELVAIMSMARRAALLRGEPVTLVVDRGVWRVDADDARAAAPIASGSLESAVGALRVHVSPLGTCVADASGQALAESLNALDCRFGAPVEVRAR